MTITQESAQKALDELSLEIIGGDDIYTGSICGHEGEMILDKETVDTIRAALQHFAQPPASDGAEVALKIEASRLFNAAEKDLEYPTTAIFELSYEDADIIRKAILI